VLLCNTFSIYAEYKEVSFIQASPEEVKNILSATGQYSLVYFTADWCLPCQILEEGHFRDERIINLINNGFVSVKADYSEKKDIEWYERFEVKMLPTLMILDMNGNEVSRIQNIRNTRQLYLFLREHSQLPITHSKPMAFKLEENRTNKVNPSNRNEETVTASYTSESKPVARLVSNSSTENNIYEVDADGYQKDLSIQFAAYTRYGNALEYLNTLLKDGMQVSILEEYVNSEKYYKVVQHVSKSNIKSLYKQYQSEGKECFIRPGRVKY